MILDLKIGKGKDEAEGQGSVIVIVLFKLHKHAALYTDWSALR